jgi:glycerophosphoryl diester phosphodiesterase
MIRCFDLQGHRGARGLFPENTLEGFRATLAVGVNTFELDVGMTADGVAVVHHDLVLNPDVARAPDGLWLAPPVPLLRDLKFSALNRFDVGRLRPGSRYASDFPDQVSLDGAKIPRLADVLRIDPTVHFNLELKTDPNFPDKSPDPSTLADTVMAEVDAAGVLSRITVEAFDWRCLHHLRRTRPDVGLAWLTSPETIRDAALWWDGPRLEDFGGSVPRVVAAEGGPIWAPAHADLTEGLIREAHDLSLRVVPWTVNQPAAMRRLIQWGADGLITDRPDLANLVLRQAGLSVPPIRRC